MKPLKSFKHVRRVRVCAPDSPVCGFTGTVHRRRIGDDGAWVRMDQDLPDSCRTFPADDPRCRDIMLYPEDCELETPEAEADLTLKA